MGVSKKHFKAIAEILHSHQADENLIQDFIDFLSKENERFMPDKFRCACNGVKWQIDDKANDEL